MASPTINPVCPSDSTFIACDYGTRFLGCCLSTLSTNQVCSNGCPSNSIQPASFERPYYTLVTDGQCESALGKWYTCADTDPPFFGCCSFDACQNGCPGEGLVAAMLSENQAQKNAYAPLEQEPLAESSEGAVSSSSSAVESTTTATTSVTAASSSSFATTAAAAPSSPGAPVLIGGVVGGVVGGIIISAILAAFIIFWRLRRSSKGNGKAQEDFDNASSTTHLTPMYTSQANRSHHELPTNTPENINHELPSTPTPVRELASLEIPAPIYELPSPVPSPGLSIRAKASASSLGRGGGAGVSPLIGPYTPDTPGAKSEISMLEVGTERDG